MSDLPSDAEITRRKARADQVRQARIADDPVGDRVTAILVQLGLTDQAAAAAAAAATKGKSA